MGSICISTGPEDRGCKISGDIDACTCSSESACSMYDQWHYITGCTGMRNCLVCSYVKLQGV